MSHAGREVGRGRLAGVGHAGEKVGQSGWQGWAIRVAVVGLWASEVGVHAPAGTRHSVVGQAATMGWVEGVITSKMLLVVVRLGLTAALGSIPEVSEPWVCLVLPLVLVLVLLQDVAVLVGQVGHLAGGVWSAGGADNCQLLGCMGWR